MRIVFIGTGTGVGKTYAAAALSHVLAERLPSPPLALKPIETGFTAAAPGTPPQGSDAATLEASANCGPVARPHPLYSFPDPISPHLAARRSGLSIDLQQIHDWIRRAESKYAALHGAQCPATVVELAGGAMSPITDTLLNAHLAAALDPCYLVLVASDSLGALHDVRATIDALRLAHRAPDFLLLSEARTADASTGTNAAELARLGLPPVAVVAKGRADVLADFATTLLRQ